MTDDKMPSMSRLSEMQSRVADRVDLTDSYSTEYVAGVDQAFPVNRILSGAMLLNKSMEVIDRACSIMHEAFPYFPGYLFFREGPAAIMAIKRLSVRPTLLFVDGCGIDHPQMAGMASFIGVLLDMPTIGITKNVLCGEAKPPERVGDSSLLIYNGVPVGHLLKSGAGCRPIVIAPGHRVSMRSSLELARRYILHSKLPEPCRLAHQYVNQVKGDRFSEEELSEDEWSDD